MFDNVTIEEAMEMVKKAGGKSNLQNTSSDWKRVFVLTPNNVTIGRISFNRGVIGGFKCYKKWYRQDIDETDIIFINLGRLLNGDSLITKDKIIETWEEALVFVKKDFAKKQEWRNANPRFNKHGQPASRPKLTGRNPRHVLIELINKI